VGTADSISVTRSAQPTPTPTSGLVIPTPNQANNVVSSCNKVAQALEGDYCYVSRTQISSSTGRLTKHYSSLPSETELLQRNYTRGIVCSQMAMLVAARSGKITGIVWARPHRDIRNSEIRCCKGISLFIEQQNINQSDSKKSDHGLLSSM
jgi:hypothetical protein